MKKINKFVKVAVAGILAAAAPFIIVALTATAPVMVTGCVTGGGITTNEIEAASLILQSTADAGALVAITPPSGNTNNIVYFNLAAQSIGLFLTGTNYSPAAFQQALMAVNSSQTTNIWVQLAIGSLVDLYQGYFSQYVQNQVNGNYAAITFLTAVQTGFDQALGKPVPATLRHGMRPALTGPVLPRPLKKSRLTW